MKTVCPNCKKEYTPNLAKRPDWEAKNAQWKKGAFIQRVWPKATSTQREQLQTGICSDACWDEFLRIADKGRP